MRIIRGKYKTRFYKFPKGFPSRPTTDYAKEGLFNILEHQYPNTDLKILDLCAGTGNISIEFLSREAGTVLAVDKNYTAIRHMKKVVHELGCENEMTVYKADIIKFLESTDMKFDLIFADPPYLFESHKKIVELVFNRKILNEDGVLIIEHGRDTNLDDITHFEFSRIYGNVHFSFFE
ncbi:MAG: 16S rRNA (guanine(966)-N(2))-methyltransferase RsmD [Crocinitomicaceae bacterium]|nr:16S rRNA (guanine(966)-N(2))-methyltransferase RsmD [Crocinitomicaceae bacterium]